MIPKFEGLLNTEFKSLKTPMPQDYHPETNNTPLLSDKDTSIYRSIIGSLNWLITLGRFDVHYATNSLSRFNMAPREGHLKAATKILSYVKTRPKGRIVFDVSYKSWSHSDEDKYDWTKYYPDIKEELPHDRPAEKENQ